MSGVQNVLEEGPGGLPNARKKTGIPCDNRRESPEYGPKSYLSVAYFLKIVFG